MKKWAVLACLLTLCVLLAACHGTNETQTSGNDTPNETSISEAASSEAETSSEDSEPSVAGLYVNEAPADEDTLTDVLILQEDGRFTREIVTSTPVNGMDAKTTMTGTYRMEEDHCWAKVTGSEYSLLGLDKADGEELQAYLDSLREEGDDEAFERFSRLMAGEILDGADMFGEDYVAFVQMFEYDNILNTETKTFRTRSSF